VSTAGSSIGSAPVRSGPGGFHLWSDLRASLGNPEFWAFSSWLDLLVRARRSALGPFWLMAPALVYVFGLGSFFAEMQGKRIGEFAAYVALGAMVFRTLMSAVIGSSNVFNSSQSFIMDGQMRMTDYLLQSLAKSFFDLCMYLPVTVVALALFGGFSWEGLLWAPVTLLVIYVNGLWITVVFALGGARLPDLGQLVQNVSIFLFLLTPIIWYAETMPAGSLRGQLMRFNPFYHFVTLFRAPILGQPVEPASYWYVGIMTVGGLVLATVLYRRYARFVPLWI
jgi:ABC-2 type transport system permease protein